MNPRTLTLHFLLWLTVCCPLFISSVHAAPPGATRATITPEHTTLLNNALGEPFQHTSANAWLGIARKRPSIYLDSEQAYAIIDQATGILVQMIHHNLGTLHGSEEPALTADQAKTNALGFLNRIGVTPDGLWTLKENQLLDPRQTNREYTFEWRKIYQGIQLPSMILVSVDADSGQIHSYFLMDDPVIIPLNMNLTAEDAVRVAVQAQGWNHYIIEKVAPIINYVPDYPGKQTLLWTVAIVNADAPNNGPGQYIIVDIDALTGNVTLVHRFGGGKKSEYTEKTNASRIPKIDKKALKAAKAPPTLFQIAKEKKNAKH